MTAALFLRPVVDPLWKAFLLAMLGAYVIWTIFHVLPGATWSRWFTRRSDRALAEVVGREQLVQWLRQHAAAQQPVPLLGRLSWLSRGAPPDPAERLCRLQKG